MKKIKVTPFQILIIITDIIMCSIGMYAGSKTGTPLVFWMCFGLMIFTLSILAVSVYCSQPKNQNSISTKIFKEPYISVDGGFDDLLKDRKKIPKLSGTYEVKSLNPFEKPESDAWNEMGILTADEAVAICIDLLEKQKPWEDGLLSREHKEFTDINVPGRLGLGTRIGHVKIGNNDYAVGISFNDGYMGVLKKYASTKQLECSIPSVMNPDYVYIKRDDREICWMVGATHGIHKCSTEVIKDNKFGWHDVPMYYVVYKKS